MLLSPSLRLQETKNGCLALRQNDISHPCVPEQCLSYRTSPVQLFHQPITHLCVKLGLCQGPQLRETDVLKFWMQQELQPTILQKDLVSMLMLSWLSRIIVYIITSGNLLPDSDELWSAKIQISHIRLAFLFM